MRNVSAFLFVLVLPLLATPNDPGIAVQHDPGMAVQQARDHISAKRYADAVDVLKGALAVVDRLSPADREKAVAAVHFYTAVALSGLKADADATAHLQEFFGLVPNARLTSPEKYEAHFVELFRNAQPRDDKADFRFETYYPGFSSYNSTAEDDKATSWGNSPAIVLLASKREKQQWESVIPSAERARFIQEFWKRRDPRPETPNNEFRDTFNRRVAFADHVFGSPGERGSISDRGRVFVLLGAPSSVRRRPLTQSDPVIVLESSVVINGTVEQWVYAKEQLPIRIAKKFVGYRFITQKGIGDNVLQREDPYAFQALMAAMNPNEQKNE